MDLEDGLVHVVVKARQEYEGGRSWADTRVETTLTPAQFAQAAEAVAFQVPNAQRRYIDVRRRPDAPDPDEVVERLLREAGEDADRG